MNEKKKYNFNKLLKEFISGNLIHGELIIKNVSFILFIVFLCTIFIAIRNYNEKIIRENATLQKDVEELKTELLFLKASLTNCLRKSEINKQIKNYELNFSINNTPPKIVIVKCQK
ncbi:MAG: FtsL-like putative cell division protein [Bacteroidales bacterium]|nr:FtsL-like putative cell division protein [Bacteroidales bacterium]